MKPATVSILSFLVVGSLAYHHHLNNPSLGPDAQGALRDALEEQQPKKESFDEWAAIMKNGELPASKDILSTAKETPPPDAVKPVIITIPIPELKTAAIKPSIYTGTSVWRFIHSNELKKLGVEGDSENVALNNCRADGNLNCVIRGSEKVRYLGDDRYEGKGSAGNVEPRSRCVTISRGSKWTKEEKFDKLTQIGVIKSARNTAFSACWTQNLQDCVIINSSLDGCNLNKIFKYECKGIATARGCF